MTIKKLLRSSLNNVFGPFTAQALKRAYADRRPASAKGGLLARLTYAFGSDKWGSHWYANHYQQHFAQRRWTRLHLLEIGTGGYDDPRAGGESLRAWKWFFPRAQITGIDIEDKKVHEERRVRTFQGSQADAEFLRTVISHTGPPDIVIDDGSHMNEHVIASFEVLFPLLKDGGIYVVEDTQTAYWPTYGGRGPTAGASATTSLEYFKALTDGLNHAEYLQPGYVPTYYDRHIVSMHFYHNLVFIYKGINDEGSNCVKDGVLHC